MTEIINIGVLKAKKLRDDFIGNDPKLLKFQKILEREFAIGDGTPENNLKILSKHLNRCMKQLNKTIKS